MVCDILLIFYPLFIQVMFAGHIFGGVVVIGFLYCKILRTAIKQRQKIDIDNVAGTESGKSKITKLKKDARAAKNIALVIGVYASCLCPVTLIYLVSYTYDLENEETYVAFTKSYIEFLRTIFTLLAIFNSCLNPIIYGLRMKTFKNAYKKLLGCRVENLLEETILDNTRSNTHSK